MPDKVASEKCVFQFVIDLVGQSSASQIVRAWGGKKLYIPSQPNKKHALARVAGFQAMQSLCEKFRSCAIDVPTQEAIANAQTRKMIANEARAGVATKDIARRHGRSVSRVNEIKRGINETEKHV